MPSEKRRKNRKQNRKQNKNKQKQNKRTKLTVGTCQQQNEEKEKEEETIDSGLNFNNILSIIDCHLRLCYLYFFVFQIKQISFQFISIHSNERNLFALSDLILLFLFAQFYFTL